MKPGHRHDIIAIAVQKRNIMGTKQGMAVQLTHTCLAQVEGLAIVRLATTGRVKQRKEGEKPPNSSSGQQATTSLWMASQYWL
jgi:hypothetical protein